MFKVASTLIQAELETKKQTLTILTAINKVLGQLTTQRDTLAKQLLLCAQQNSFN